MIYFSDVIKSCNLHVTVFYFIYRTQYHMKYIDSPKCITNNFVSNLTFINFSF